MCAVSYTHLDVYKRQVQAQLDSIANEYAALANKNAQTLNDIEGVQGKIDDRCV